MIFRPQQILFLHIQRTAGTSLELTLCRLFGLTFGVDSPATGFGYDPDLRLYRQHATPAELMRHGWLTPDEFREFFTFTVVRNPYNRVRSAYRMDPAPYPGFAEFVRDALRPDGARQWFPPQHEYLAAPDGTPVNFVARFERLHQDVDELAARLGLPLSPLPVIYQFRSGDAIPYDAETAGLVREFFAEDFERLGYHPDTIPADTLPPVIVAPVRPLRGNGLEVSEVADGLLVYRAADDSVHHLNEPAAVVFELCDGRLRDGLTDAVASLLGVPSQQAATIVDRAVAELAGKELIR